MSRQVIFTCREMSIYNDLLLICYVNGCRMLSSKDRLPKNLHRNTQRIAASECCTRKRTKYRMQLI